MKIGNKDTDQKIYIIAEVGNNHEGNFAVAEKLVHLAAELPPHLFGQDQIPRPRIAWRLSLPSDANDAIPSNS